MAFFKFRTAGKDAKGRGAARQPESIEVIRRRARHRLIGATVLVLIGVLGFPVLFDTQPRPISVDIPIEIPDRNKARPLAVPARPATPAPEASGRVSALPAAPAPAVAPAPAAAPQQASAMPQPRPEAAPATPAAAAEPKPEPKPEPKVAAKPAAAADDGSKAKALLEGKAATAQAVEGRYVVQVGAFADATKAREVRAKVERAGLKTYTHVAETKDGKRIRVRVGPFPTRGEADKAASKIKGLDLPAAILTL